MLKEVRVVEVNVVEVNVVVASSKVRLTSVVFKNMMNMMCYKREMGAGRPCKAVRSYDSTFM